MDLINGFLEFISGLLVWWNVRRLYIDKRVLGISIWSTALFDLWGLWNMVYYPSLDQWWSFAGGVVLSIANVTWTVMAIHYGRGKDVEQPANPGSGTPPQSEDNEKITL